MQRALPAAIVILCGIIGQAAAQQPYVRPQTNPYPKPAFSPYLNLNRFGANPAINYYGIVRPELQYYRDIGQLQNQTSTLAAAYGTMEPGGGMLPYTGHPTQFLNLSHYFMNSGGGGTPGSGSPASRQSGQMGAGTKPSFPRQGK